MIVGHFICWRPVHWWWDVLGIRIGNVIGCSGDSLGHDVGDEALGVVAGRLGACLRDGDTLCRTGGDEFVVVAEDVGDGAVDLAGRICDAVGESFELHGRQITLSASVGVAMAERGLESPVELVRDAGLAMVKARHRGGGTVQSFDRALYRSAAERLDLEEELRAALERRNSGRNAASAASPFRPDARAQ